MTEELGGTRGLAARVALVTGASKGIGAATVRGLAEAGANVAAGFGGDREAAEDPASGLFEGNGGRAVAVGGDASDAARIPETVGEVEDALGPVDVLVPNAGIAIRQGSEEVTVEDRDKTMDVNLWAAFLFAQRVAPGMRERGWGRIVFVSSAAAYPYYTASKAALMGLTRAGEPALAPHGVTVNAVAPAFIGQTGMIPGASEEMEDPTGQVPVGRGCGRDPHGRRQPLRHGPDRLHRRRALPTLRNRDRKHEER